MYECLYPAGTHSLAQFLVRLFTQLRALFNRAVNAKSLWADRPSWRWDEGLIHWEGGECARDTTRRSCCPNTLGPTFPHQEDEHVVVSELATRQRYTETTVAT